MKEKIYKLFLTFMVSLSLGSGSLAQNEIRKLLEALLGTGDIQVVQELDEEEKQKESEEIRKKNFKQLNSCIICKDHTVRQEQSIFYVHKIYVCV